MNEKGSLLDDYQHFDINQRHPQRPSGWIYFLKHLELSGKTRIFAARIKIEEEMKKILTFLLAVLGLNTACSQSFENMDVKEFAELIADSNVVILDVRTADEYAEGHIKGAILIDQNKSDFVEQANAKLPKDKTIAIYCRSGRRSANSATLLAKEGYKLVNLKGGIIAWTKEEEPVVAD